jgi:hypothetical protein
MLARGGASARPRTVVDVQPPDLTVSADRERLHQVAANLLDNAIRHSPPGGVVTLRARPLPGFGPAVRGGDPARSGIGVRIEVCDEGPGIPPGERVRVFDRFDRGSGQAADGGTGLGLAIARWVVDLHGGRISVAEPDGSVGEATDASAQASGAGRQAATRTGRRGRAAKPAAGSTAPADHAGSPDPGGSLERSGPADTVSFVTSDGSAPDGEHNDLKEHNPAPGCVIRVDLP